MNRPVTVGFDAKKAVKNLTGIGNYSRRCIAALAAAGNDFVPLLFTAERGRPEALSELPEGVERVGPSPLLRSGLLRELWRCLLLRREIAARGVSVYHGLSNEIPFLLTGRCATVVTIHDLIFLRRPETFGWLDRLILRWKTRYACRHADVVVAISESTKRDLMSLYATPEEKLRVVYQSINPVYFNAPSPALDAGVRQRLGLPARYVLCVGTIQQRKNQECLVRAMSLWPDDIALVLVGGRTAYQERVEQTARQLGVDGRLHILNSLGTDLLPSVYRGASVFALMSTYEGFGLPVAEALACGVPVIAATGSCLEEAGGPASIYLSPSDHEGVAAAVSSILADSSRAASMSARGRDYARRFTDSHMAAALTSIYSSLA